MQTHENDPFRGEHHTVPQLVVLDFDRTLGDVDAAMARLFSVAETLGIATDTIKEAQKKVQADGGSFDPLQYVQAQLEPATFNAFLDSYRQRAEPTLLYPDAERLLARLSAHSVPFIVVTYGVNHTWQHLKVTASGYTGPLRILDHPHKAQELHSWEEQEKETFSPPAVPIRTGSLCLVDDKPISFAGLPENCQGYWIVRSTAKLPSQQGSVPENVVVINTLDELDIQDGQLACKKKI